MENGIGMDKSKMVEELRGRLNWLVNEAPKEEYSDEEVKAIRNLLDVMETEELDTSYYNPEKGFERFKETLEIRMRIQDEMRRTQAGEVSLADYPDDDECADDDDAEYDEETGGRVGCDSMGCDSVGCGSMSCGSVGCGSVSCGAVAEDFAKEKPSKGNNKTFFRSRGLHRGLIAAALVLALFVGGTVGAYAEKNGFFHFIKRDKDGMSIMTSPEGLSGSTESSQHYFTLDEVPEKYRGYIWEPEQVPHDMEFVRYDIVKYKDWDRVLGLYRDDEQELRLEIIARIFASGIEYHSQKYDSYIFLYSKEYNGTIMEYYEQDDEGDTEYAVCFLYDNVQYIVRGCLALDDVEKIASEYCRAIVK